MTTVASLREAALALLAPLQPVRIPGRKQVYRFSDGTIGWFRTAPRGMLVSRAIGPNADDRLIMEDGPHTHFIIAVPARRGDAVDVFMVPKDRLIADYRAAYPAESNTNIDMRAIRFDGDPANPWSGFRSKYAAFLVEASELPPAPPSGPAAGLLAMPELVALRERLAREFGIGQDEIHVAVHVAGGRLVFNL
jgi:hypothetical protein